MGEDVLRRLLSVGQVDDEDVAGAWAGEGQEGVVAVWTQHTQTCKD